MQQLSHIESLMLAVSPTVFQLDASVKLLHSRLKVMVSVFLSAVAANVKHQYRLQP